MCFFRLNGVELCANGSNVSGQTVNQSARRGFKMVQ